MERNAVKLLLSDGSSKTLSTKEKISLLWGAHEAGKEFVTVQSGSSLELAEWIYASFQSPVTIVPLSPHLPTSAVQRIESQLPIGSFISHMSLQKNGAVPADYSKPLDSFWVVIFTSGSTGSPKGVVLSGQQLKNSAQAHHSRFPKQPWILSIPAFHIGGFSILSRSFFLDLPLAVSTNKAEDWLPWFFDGRVKGISLVPTQLERLLKTTESVGSMDTILVGGASVNSQLRERAQKLPVYLTYGMTETASQVATSIRPWENLAPLPNVIFTLSPESELMVKTPTLASGYLENGRIGNLPLSAEGFFQTGDIAQIEKSTISILGRSSERIQTGGIKIFPQEIETQLADFSTATDPAAAGSMQTGANLEVAVCGVPDSYWGEMIVLTYCGNENLVPEIRRHLSLKLDQRLMPKHILPLEKIPRTENGKILRKDLSRIVSEILSKKK